MPPAIATDSLFVQLSDDRCVMGRRDLPAAPHVTLMWKTRSGEIDLHLKWQDGRSEPYESLLRIDEGQVRRAVSEVADIEVSHLRAWWLRNVRRYRPGWLRRNGFLIAWLPPETVEELIRAYAPIKKGRHRVNVSGLTSPLLHRRLMSENLYDPAILHHIPRILAGGGEAEVPFQVMALEDGGRRRRRVHLTLQPSRDGFHWAGIRIGAFEGYLQERIQRLVQRGVLGGGPALARVWEVLSLHDLRA